MARDLRDFAVGPAQLQLTGPAPHPRFHCGHRCRATAVAQVRPAGVTTGTVIFVQQFSAANTCSCRLLHTVDTGANMDLNWIWNQISRWQSLLESYPSCNL